MADNPTIIYRPGAPTFDEQKPVKDGVAVFYWHDGVAEAMPLTALRIMYARIGEALAKHDYAGLQCEVVPLPKGRRGRGAK